MTSPDAEREAAWVAAFDKWIGQSENKPSPVQRILMGAVFSAGYEAYRASAAPAPDAGEREAIRTALEGSKKVFRDQIIEMCEQGTIEWEGDMEIDDYIEAVETTRVPILHEETPKEILESEDFCGGPYDGEPVPNPPIVEAYRAVLDVIDILAVPPASSPARDRALILQGVKAGLEAAARMFDESAARFTGIENERHTVAMSQAFASAIRALDAVAIAAQAE